MEYLRSSHSARIASWILRDSVRSWVRNRFFASCWVSVEPPSMPLAPDHVAHEGARDADRIDAEMLVEPPVLDRHERLGQIGRQVDQPDRGAAGVAAIGDERAVVGEDGDVGRPLGHRELIDRRQLARVIGDERDRSRSGPIPRARRPNRRDAPSQERASACAGRAADRDADFLVRRPVWRAVGGVGAKIDPRRSRRAN